MAMDANNSAPMKRGGRKRRKVCAFCVDKVEHIDYKADHGDQARPSGSSAAVCDGLIRFTWRKPAHRDKRCAGFCMSEVTLHS